MTKLKSYLNIYTKMKNMKIIKFISKNNLKGGIYILKCYNNEKFILSYFQLKLILE